jgi:hypothetical protein
MLWHVRTSARVLSIAEPRIEARDNDIADEAESYTSLPIDC